MTDDVRYCTAFTLIPRAPRPLPVYAHNHFWYLLTPTSDTCAIPVHTCTHLWFIPTPTSGLCPFRSKSTPTSGLCPCPLPVHAHTYFLYMPTPNSCTLALSVHAHTHIRSPLPVQPTPTSGIRALSTHARVHTCTMPIFSICARQKSVPCRAKGILIFSLTGEETRGKHEGNAKETIGKRREVSKRVENGGRWPTPCRRATPKTAISPLHRCSARGVQGGRRRSQAARRRSPAAGCSPQVLRLAGGLPLKRL
jgi:hypothetical protein